MPKKKSPIVQHKLKAGATINGFAERNSLFALVTGEGDFSDTQTAKRRINEELIVFIQIHSSYSFSAIEDSTLIILRLDKPIKFSDTCGLESIYTSNSLVVGDKNVLRLRNNLKSHPGIWNSFFEMGIVDSSFWESLLELFFVIIYYKYSKDELRSFLFLASCPDYLFSAKVYENLENCRTVIELAKSLNYSVSGFEKRFKRVFKVSCYKWMREQIAKQIQLDVGRKDLSIQEMSDKYRFSSVGAFTRFCKDMFGVTPAVFRKNQFIDRNKPIVETKKSK